MPTSKKPEKSCKQIDAVGNLAQVCYPQLTNSFFYDALNELPNMGDAAGITRFAWDAAGQLLSAGGPWPGDTVGYSYTNRLRIGMSVGSGWNQGYSYDLARRLTGLTSPAGAFGYSHEVAPPSPLVSIISLPNGAQITNSYDVMARLSQTALNNFWGHTLDGYSYVYDLAGERTNVTRNLGLTASTVSAGYDTIGELTSWTALETNGTARMNEQLGWAYDPAGNLCLRTNGGLVQTFAMNAVNELTNVARTGALTVTGNTPAPATRLTVNGQAAQIYGDFTFASTNHALVNGDNAFTNIAQNLYGLAVTNISSSFLPTPITLLYDANGNLTNDGLRSFSYDAENQLATVFVSGQWQSVFVYDGMMRRRIERDYNWNGSAWVQTNEVRFIYDDKLMVQERDTDNNPLVTYMRGLDLSQTLQGAGGIGGLLTRTDGNGSTFYHADGNGNVTGLINANENMVARYLYNPFGRLLGQWGTLAGANEMRFSSKEWNVKFGLYYYLYRFYDPNLQRWPNRDPIENLGFRRLNRIARLNSGKDAFANLYEFVKNAPGRFIDPLGLELYWPPQIEGNCNSIETASCQQACAAQGLVLKKCTAVTEKETILIFDNGITKIWQTTYTSYNQCECVDPRSVPPPTDCPPGGVNNPPPPFPPRQGTSCAALAPTVTALYSTAVAELKEPMKRSRATGNRIIFIALSILFIVFISAYSKTRNYNHMGDEIKIIASIDRAVIQKFHFDRVTLKLLQSVHKEYSEPLPSTNIPLPTPALLIRQATFEAKEKQLIVKLFLVNESELRAEIISNEQSFDAGQFWAGLVREKIPSIEMEFK